MFARWGYRDPLAVAAEPFHLWVIEGPPRIAAELPLAKAGLNVVWTGDLKPYRERKVRLLNGAHTAIALPAFLAGIDTVRETVEDPLFARYLQALLFDDIAPYVPLPDHERRAYAETVAERFANPFLRHELISIALNSVSKWRVRILPTVKDAVAAGRGAPPNLAFSLAALFRFYRGRAEGGTSFRRARARRLSVARRSGRARGLRFDLGRGGIRRRGRRRLAPACARRGSGERTCRRSPVSKPRRGRRRRRSKGSAFAARSRNGSRKRRQAGREPDLDARARRCLSPA